MYIGLDLDGVTARYVEGLRDAVAKALGITPEDVGGEPEDYGFSNWREMKDRFKELHTGGVAEGLYRKLAIFEGASEILWKLSDEGDEIGVVTSRFVKHRQNGIVVRDTAYWLDDNNVPYRDLCFLRDKTRFLADVYLDDAPHNIEAFQAAGRYVIIFDAPYNRHLEGDRAYNWNDVYALIQKRKAEVAAAAA